MIFAFEREPTGWVHPLCRNRRRPCSRGTPFGNWSDIMIPAWTSAISLNDMFQSAYDKAMSEQSPSTSQQAEKKVDDKFEIKFSVQQFTPDELTVKLVDNCLVVEGKHEEKQDEQGHISRHFVRRYQIPDDVKPETVTCSLGSDGVLVVSAPRMIEQKPATETTIPINFTGQAGLEKNLAEGETTPEKTVEEATEKST